jgi:protein TonB
VASTEPLPVSGNSASQSAPVGVPTAQESPDLSATVSPRVAGGQLVYRVPPVYPAEALLLRLEGKVIFAAIVMEDGTVSDVKVVAGPPVLAESAVDAVKHWRYQPFALDGKPVKNQIGISVEFKFPESTNR